MSHTFAARVLPIMPEIPEWLAYLIYTVTGIGVGGYAIRRRVKSDSNADKTDDKTQRLIDSLTAQLEKERTHASHLGTVIDRVSAERNEAVTMLGELRGQLKVMTQQIKLLQGEVRNQEILNRNLNTTVSGLRDEILLMSNKISSGN